MQWTPVEKTQHDKCGVTPRCCRLVLPLTVFHGVLHGLPRLQPASPAAVFGVVVDEHVVGHGQDVAVHAHGARQDHLEGRRRWRREDT